jgi:hypothetical protein
MGVVIIVLLVLACVSFLAAVANFPARFNLIGLGLLLWCLTDLLAKL